MSLREENASWLRVRFTGRLLSLRPESVLDVGTGLGQLLIAMRSAGVPASGVEADTAKGAVLRELGLDVCEGTAERLPYADASFGWVALRHVLHHLKDPAAAIREGARVARDGLVLAEPWRDPALRGQERGHLLDRWLKRQDRRLGHEHHDDLAPVELAQLLEATGTYALETERHQRLSVAPLEEFQEDIDARLVGLDDDHAERRALDPLLDALRPGGVGLTGTAILVATRTSA